MTNRSASIYDGKVYYEQLILNYLYQYGFDSRTLPYNINPDKKKEATYVKVTTQLIINGINYIDVMAGLASVRGAYIEWWDDMGMKWNKT